jgi:hypothetical protein
MCGWETLNTLLLLGYDESFIESFISDIVLIIVSILGMIGFSLVLFLSVTLF